MTKHISKIIKYSLAAATLLTPIGLYLIKFQGSLSQNHSAWGEFGSYIGGLYGALGFFALAYTTIITQKQFQIQNQDSLFLKLLESIENRINSTLTIDNQREYTGHQKLKFIAEEFRNEFKGQAPLIARELLCKSPEKVHDTHLYKMIIAINGMERIDTLEEDKTKFIQSIINEPDFNSRWELLKTYFGSTGSEKESILEALEHTGTANFYKIPFDERREYYKMAKDQMLDKYGDFLDGYIRNIFFLLEFIKKSINHETYTEFLISQLTKYELVILFYVVFSEDAGRSKVNNFIDFGLFQQLAKTECLSLMFDEPSKDEIQKEIRYLIENQT